MTTLHDFHATAIDGTDTDLSAYAGKLVLVVNTASECGYTGQYKGLQELHETYADRVRLVDLVGHLGHGVPPALPALSRRL